MGFTVQHPSFESAQLLKKLSKFHQVFLSHKIMHIMKLCKLIIMLITNEEVRRCGVVNLEHRLSKMRLRWFGHVK